MLSFYDNYKSDGYDILRKGAWVFVETRIAGGASRGEEEDACGRTSRADRPPVSVGLGNAGEERETARDRRGGDDIRCRLNRVNTKHHLTS